MMCFINKKQVFLHQRLSRILNGNDLNCQGSWTLWTLDDAELRRVQRVRNLASQKEAQWFDFCPGSQVGFLPQKEAGEPMSSGVNGSS